MFESRLPGWHYAEAERLPRHARVLNLRRVAPRAATLRECGVRLGAGDECSGVCEIEACAVSVNLACHTAWSRGGFESRR